MSNTHSGTPTIDDQTAETPLADLCHVGGQDFSDLCEDIFTLCGKRLTLSALKEHKKEKFIEMKAHNNNVTMEFLCMWIDKYKLDRWFKQDAKKDKEELHGEYHLEGHPKKYFGPDFDPRKDYKEDACSFSPHEQVGRPSDFSLVCGPSGSGKTIFCLRRFGVHFLGGNTFTFMAKMSDYNFSQESRQSTINKIVKLLRGRFHEYTNSFPIEDIVLCIVFDDASVSNGKHFFVNGKTPNMCWFLNEMTQVCEEVHIVFTGTNLDDITQEVDSDTPFLKVRMQRWTVDNFFSISQSRRYE